MVEVGVCIDAADHDNGPLMVVPGSHRGPVYDHHADGIFYGTVSAKEIGPRLAEAVPLLAPAGSITIHHVRMLHGAGANLSQRPRRFLLMGYSAADAWPLSAFGGADASYFQDAMVCGTAAPVARMEALPVRLPLPLPPVTSLYEIQRGHPDRLYTQTAAELEGLRATGLTADRLPRSQGS